MSAPMTVNQIEGMALSRVQNPDDIRRLPLRRELQGAFDEIIQDIRDADSDLADDTTKFDLTAEVNTYPFPRAMDSIKRVGRYDLTGAGVEDPIEVPCRPVPFNQIEKMGQIGVPCYCVTPVGMVIWPTPSTDMRQALHVITLPVAEDLVEDGDYPAIPAQMHQPLAAKLMRRLGTMAGVTLADGAADFITEQARYLNAFLHPSNREAVTRFVRTKAIYQTRRF